MTIDTRPDPMPAGARRAPRWMKIALVLSVAFNLAILGLIAGAVAFGPRSGHGFTVREVGFGPFDRALSPRDREALREQFQDRMGGRWTEMKAIRQDFQDLVAALRAQPFQPDALWSLAAQQEHRLTERLKLGQSLLIERVIAMSQEERLRFADRLEEEMSRGPRGEDRPQAGP